jgi:hypothetical protein
MQNNNSIYQAILEFQRNSGAVIMSAVNPRFKSKYASLTDIQKAIRKPLADAGLVIVHQLGENNTMTSSLIHAETGQSISSTYNLIVQRNDMQALGSAITYAKRYAVAALLDIITDEDDDGNKAVDSMQGNRSPSKYGDDDDKPWFSEKLPNYEDVCHWVAKGNDPKKLRDKYKVSRSTMSYLQKLFETAPMK